MAITKFKGLPDTSTPLNPTNLNNNFELLGTNNAGFHNSIYRGKDITKSFYDGTVSKNIANGTFDDIFIGDYIIGKSSGRKYLVSDINYRLHKGDQECTTQHILMIPDLIMGMAKMNNSDIATGAYIGSEMYTTNLNPFKTIIQNDFGIDHILSHKNQFANAINDNCESNIGWYNSTIELMNELMVFGSNIFHNVSPGTIKPTNQEVDNSQLSLFRLDKSKIIAFDDSGSRQFYWLRNVSKPQEFCNVTGTGYAHSFTASAAGGVRPCFLIY